MSSKKKKFYAVAKGRKPGIYEEWYGDHGADSQVTGFPDASFKSFSRLKDARAWLQEFEKPAAPKEPPPQPRFLFELEGPAKPADTSSKPAPNTGRELKKGKVIIYSDGACIGNPGPGGYGVVLRWGDKRKELSAGFRRTTNNRMELLAAIAGLQALRFRCSVTLFSDSRYVVNGIKKGWAKRWRSKKWMRTKEKAAENADLWARLLDLCDNHDVRFHWIRGHAGQKENERCDKLAFQAAQDNPEHAVDTAYETGQTKVPIPAE